MSDIHEQVNIHQNPVEMPNQQFEDFEVVDKTQIYNTEDFATLLDHQDRMVYDLADKKNKNGDAKIKKQAGLGVTAKELDEIDMLLDVYAKGNLEKTTALTNKDFEEYKGQLKFKRTMDIAQLLVNDHSKSDSKEMQDVKIDILALSVEMERMNSVPVSKESISDISAKFAMSLNSISHYLHTKKPRFSTGKKRYRQVQNMQAALFEVKNALDIVASDIEKYEGRTVGSILGMRESRQGDLRRKEDEKKEAPSMSKDAAFVVNLFREGHDFCASFAQSSARKRRKESAKVVALKQTLSGFVPDQTQILDVDIMGKKVRLLQKADNRLYVIENHKEIPLDKGAVRMRNDIDANMLKNAQAYNREDVNTLLSTYENASTTGEASQYRTNLIQYLKETLGLHDEDFTNELRRSLVAYTRDLINGTKTLEEVKNAIVNNDAVNTMINGVELTEMMELEKGKTEEINKKVSMYQIANEVEKNDWSDEEKSVKNLMAEFIYTTDTQTMDINVATPQEFVRTVLLQNKKALVYLLKEDGTEGDLIENIFKKMSLNEITEGEEKSFEKSIAAELRNLRDYLRGKVDTKKSPEELESNLEAFLNSDDMALTNRLKESYDNMQEGINASCDILQEKVTKMSESIFTQNEEKEKGQTLDDILKNATRGEKGQGLFTKKVFENYFSKMSTIDKRSMLASVLRGSKKVMETYYTDKELVSEIKQRGLTGYDSVLFVERDYKKYPLDDDDRRLIKKYILDKKKNAPVLKGQEEQKLTDQELLKELEEIKKQKPAGYETLFRRERDLEKEPLSENEKNLLNGLRREKKSLSIGANFLGGLIRGAGPLLQKMMQGLPEDSLPPELRVAIRDVKSNLPPMPERVVKSQIYAMIERSGKEVDRIEVVKSLGAASVGQTFLCKMYGPKFKKGKTVVIKLLRSDVQNRMKREEKVMLECAGQVDEAMKQTYEGQLGIYHNELNLVKEAENIRAGSVYNGKFDDVESEKISEVISPTANSLVLEEAPGKTLDSILLDAEKERQDMMHQVLSQRENPDGTITYYDNVEFKKENFELTKEVRNKMIDKISELIKQRDIMANICNGWVQEALYGKGYYHADLHAGNIMISKDKGTLIDYGNAVTFTPEQQTAMTRMMGAANGAVKPGDNSIDVFFNSFISLLNPEQDPEMKELLTPEKQQELKSTFEEILEMGNASEGGQRLAAALIKAQELGVKLPSEVYNFSQGQLRLQRSINDINDMISKYKVDINKIESSQSAQPAHVDAVDYVQHQVLMGISAGKVAKDVSGNYMSIYEPVDKASFIKELLDNEYKEGDEEKGIREVDKRQDFDNKYLDGISDYKENVYTNMGFKSCEDTEAYFAGKEIDKDGFIIDEERPIPLVNKMPDFSVMRKKWEELKKMDKNDENYENAKNEVYKALFPSYDAGDPIYKMFGGKSKITNANICFNEMDVDSVEEYLTIYEKWMPKRILLDDKIHELRKKQDSKKLKEDEKTALCNEIYELYSELHEYQQGNSPIVGNFVQQIQNFIQTEEYKKQLANMFEEQTTTTVTTENGEEKEITLGELFKKQVDDYTKLGYENHYIDKNNIPGWGVRADMSAKDKQKMNKMEREMCETYTKIAKLQLKRYYEGRFDKQPDIKSYDFTKVMKDVIVANIDATLVRMGVPQASLFITRPIALSMING